MDIVLRAPVPACSVVFVSVEEYQKIRFFWGSTSFMISENRDAWFSVCTCPSSVPETFLGKFHTFFFEFVDLGS